MLIVSQTIQMSVALLLTLLVGFHVVKVWQFFVLLLRGWNRAVVWRPGLFGADPHAGPETRHANAIALNSIQFNAAVMVGPALGGWALHAWVVRGVSH